MRRSLSRAIITSFLVLTVPVSHFLILRLGGSNTTKLEVAIEIGGYRYFKVTKSAELGYAERNLRSDCGEGKPRQKLRLDEFT